jgi:hypothetical protein
MPGVRKLRKIQIGKETVKGTAVAATKIWRGVGVLDDQLEVIFPDEDIGLLPGDTRSYIPKLAGQIVLEDTPLTFQQAPILMALGIDDISAGTVDGTGSNFIYTFTMATTADPGFLTGTIEGGDDEAAEEMEYGFASEMTFKGATGESWMMAGTLIGRQITEGITFTPALTIPAVEEALFSKTKLYIDAGGGTIGATQKSNTLLDAEITITTGLTPVFTADGELYFSFAKRQMPEVVMTITFEHDGTATAEKTAWRGQTVRLIRLECEGSAFATAGTVYTNHHIHFDMAGKWESFDALDEIDGNDVVRGTFRARYSSADTLFFEAVVSNEITDSFA